eukprot:CAMPEP_0198674856 /NCGR_PEP_ID=MMETSP1467-20131203/98125_1 /TAXON_ID=1462469 /ORGANISM="unid. sp., Strain CCMP2135" /LENGTH=120 /DNA_ID=CAMNT_0044411757 /DNA_START=474 /DNA_END=832 /DNA_ORIENTATION=-
MSSVNLRVDSAVQPAGMSRSGLPPLAVPSTVRPPSPKRAVAQRRARSPTSAGVGPRDTVEAMVPHAARALAPAAVPVLVRVEVEAGAVAFVRVEVEAGAVAFVCIEVEAGALVCIEIEAG